MSGPRPDPVPRRLRVVVAATQSVDGRVLLPAGADADAAGLPPPPRPAWAERTDGTRRAAFFFAAPGDLPPAGVGVGVGPSGAGVGPGGAVAYAAWRLDPRDALPAAVGGLRVDRWRPVKAAAAAAEILADLRRRERARRLVCPGATPLARLLLLADAVDELRLTVAPLIAGALGAERPTLLSAGPVPGMEEAAYLPASRWFRRRRGEPGADGGFLLVYTRGPRGEGAGRGASGRGQV